MKKRKGACLMIFSDIIVICFLYIWQGAIRCYLWPIFSILAIMYIIGPVHGACLPPALVGSEAYQQYPEEQTDQWCLGMLTDILTDTSVSAESMKYLRSFP